MSQLSYTGGGSFATSRRGGYDNAALVQAKDMIQRLGSYQAASQSTGVPVSVLRETFQSFRRNEFNPRVLSDRFIKLPLGEHQKPEEPKTLTNEEIARIVIDTVARKYQMKYSELKSVRSSSKMGKLARSMFLSCLSGFTSWSIDRVAEYAGYRSPHAAFSSMVWLEKKISGCPETKKESDSLKVRIKYRIIAASSG